MPWRLYPRNEERELDRALFRAPTAEYRGTPFWSWNTRLDVPQLLRQIEQFKQMGFGGFHIHARTGLATEYLGTEFMAAVRACTEKAAAESMLSWLYDEDRWPSGFAGGLVTKDPKHRAKHLLWTPTPYSGAVAEACQDERAAGTRSENGRLLARYDVTLTDGRLVRYRRLRDDEQSIRSTDFQPVPVVTSDAKDGHGLEAGGTGGSVTRTWYAYLETAQPSSWFNHQTYVDTFSRAAIERFIEVTHERYREAVGEFFSSVIPAIFTDEPQFPKKTTLLRADDTRDVIMPFTDDFADTFRAAYGQGLLDHLPELFWDSHDRRPSLARYRYHDHTAERFAAAFGDTLAAWFEAHGIALTGHMLGEPNLYGQTRAVGECMRALRSFQLPGIDILCDRMELTTAKQAQSIAHQYGRPGVMSELYGVTNWDFDFAGHKRQGDWQAALGVTVRVPHLAWVSMAGESKRDYPAAIGYQSPWYREYKLVEDHFARLNTVLTRGRPLVRVAVIHPVESFWLAWGPVEHNQPEWEERENAFRDVANWLSFGLIGYDYVCESLLPSQVERSKVGGQRSEAKFVVGEMAYDAVVVPHMRTIRETTLQRLTQFADAGGTVIFAGEVPSLVDAQPSNAARQLARRCHAVALTRRSLLDRIEPFREVDVRQHDGSPAESILHQIRIDGDHRHAFLCNTDRDRAVSNATIKLRGRWDVTLLDTMTGDEQPLPAAIAGDITTIAWSFPGHGHLLISLQPWHGRLAHAPAAQAGNERPRDVEDQRWAEVARLRDPVTVTLSEPNVLLLDQAEWRLNDGPWQPRDEILRLDNLARAQLNLPPRGGRNAQPWTDREPAPVLAQLQLRFTIQSEIDVRHARLAVEEAKNVWITLDGRDVPSEVTGWWVDESIHTVALPDLSRGPHELVLTIPFTRRTDVEWCYLLGGFGVAVAGRHAKLIAPVRTLAFGDWTHQGLPFYAGNVTYHCTIEGTDRETLIEVPKFKSPLLSVDLDGRLAGKIAFAPYQLNLGRLSPGGHKLDLTAYGNRHNVFAPVHNTNEKLSWVGPAAWRSDGPWWSDEYQLKREGILAAPIVRTAE